jgi:hypothetical protein
MCVCVCHPVGNFLSWFSVYFWHIIHDIELYFLNNFLFLNIFAILMKPTNLVIIFLSVVLGDKKPAPSRECTCPLPRNNTDQINEQR